MPRISNLPALTTPDNSDELAIVDTSASVTKKITRGDLLKAPLPTNSVTTAAIADGAVTASKIDLATSVIAFSNTGSAGGTGSYINMGGLKLAWGETNLLATPSATGSATGGVVFPTAFFSTIPRLLVSASPTQAVDNRALTSADALTAASFTARVFSHTGVTGVATKVTWFAIGV